jgi:hypothetical protein
MRRTSKMTETKPRVLFDNAYHARKRRDAKEIALLREALNAAIHMIDGIGRNVPWAEEAELEDALNETLHELAAFGYTEEIN